MKKFFLLLCPIAILAACNNASEKTATTSDSTTVTAEKPAVALPYTASYSSSFNDNVSDDDLKMVLTSYKDWADGDVNALVNVMADSLDFDEWNGTTTKIAKADLLKKWSSYRDSVSSVKIDMEAWNKMYSTDKKDGYIVVWYKEIDSLKNGKVDSARWHDINQVKDGKIVWYSQFRRPLKKQ
jgi:ketosteroid isomerase-like protein